MARQMISSQQRQIRSLELMVEEQRKEISMLKGTHGQSSSSSNNVKYLKMDEEEEGHSIDSPLLQIKGHHLKPKSHDIATKSNSSSDNSLPQYNSSTNNNTSSNNHSPRSSSICCKTCGSKTGLEEDEESKGIYYCSSCWDEYEKWEENQQLHEERKMETFDNHHQPLTINQNPTYQQQHSSNSPTPTVRSPLLDKNLLFILHDNPQLGSNVSKVMERETVEVLIETKKEGGISLFLTGNIKYSGPLTSYQHANASCSAGGDCFAISDVHGSFNIVCLVHFL